MTQRNLSPAAERLLAAAMRLFSEQGYEGTSVGEIQEAAGLTFGSGALYKHFSSKEAVLAEGVERFVENAQTERTQLADLDAEPIASALTAIANSAMASFSRDQDALRIVWRDLENFPQLQEKVRTERIRSTFDDFSDWLEQQHEAGRLQSHDSRAVAAVALGSLAFFQILQFLMHDTPAGIDEDRFVTAWTQLLVNALT
jgi:AcrR family transcriptional regulator